jgi:Lhr-like helicase
MALGTRIDVGGIVRIVHMEQPYGLVDFVQQTGRGRRRERKTVESVIVMNQRKAWFREQSSDVEHLNRQTMK